MELLLKKLKIPYDQNTKLPDDPAILLLGIYQKKIIIIIQKDTYIPKFIATLFTIATTWKQMNR